MLIPNHRAPNVYRLRATTTTDLYGDPRPSWADPERVRLRGAVIQSVAPYEEDPDGLQAGNRRLYCPGVVDLDAYDRIESGGQVWLIDGTPSYRRSLVGPGYTVVRLKRSERSGNG